MASPPITSVTPATHDSDPDWNQMRETVRMLELAAAQINLALSDGDDSIGTLSHSFTTMMSGVNKIDSLLDEAASEKGEGPAYHAIKQNCMQVRDQMQAAIIAFQFYDKLSQRLAHVTHSLDSMGELIGDKERLYTPEAWQQLQQTIRMRYSMQEEQEMFDALLNGSSIEEALRIYEERMTSKDHSDDIELF